MPGTTPPPKDPLVTVSPSPSRNAKRGRSRRRGRISSKSPGPGRSRVSVVEVHHRTSPIGIKTNGGKNPSPYQCKVFPLHPPPERTGPPFVVDPMTHKMLDTELARILQRDKVLLVKAMTDYYEKVASPRTSSTYSSEVPDESSIISCGSTRETFMSWIMKENRDSVEFDGEGIQYFNPMANIFRKTRSTQVSGKPSLLNNENENLENATVTTMAVGEIIPDHKIHLVGHEHENEIRLAAQNMYQGLKLLQKVIHLSDLFCFRESLPETMTQEEETATFYQSEFHQFMESRNEIEILENVMKLLGNTKENIRQYLSSLQGANLITWKDSGLTKMPNLTSSNNNNMDLCEALKSTSCKSGGDMYVELEEEAEKLEKPVNQIIPLTCPSCQSQIDVEVNTFPLNQILPKVHTFLEEQKRLNLCTYYNTQGLKRTLMQTVMCDGLRYKIQFTSSDPCGPIQGILSAKREYLGQPSPLSLDMLLSTIHRCTSYIDTRIACSCVWSRQSKHYLLTLIEKYLDKDYRPSTRMNRWQFSKLGKKLKKINVFAGIIQNFCDDLVEAVSKLQFCMQKSMLLLDKSMKNPDLPGFVSSKTIDCAIGWDEMNNAEINEDFTKYNRDCKEEIEKSRSVEMLYRKLKNRFYSEKETSLDKIYNQDQNLNEDQEDQSVSVEALMKIVGFSIRDITTMCRIGEEYFANVKMPGKNGRRVMRFMNAAVAQLGCSKDIDMGALIATYLSSVEKISMFEEFICEQKVEIRSGVHKMSSKIIRKLSELRSHVWMQKHWSRNLAKNSYLKIKEVNEVKRLRKLKKNRHEIEDELEMMRGSDESLRLSVH